MGQRRAPALFWSLRFGKEDHTGWAAVESWIRDDHLGACGHGMDYPHLYRRGGKPGLRWDSNDHSADRIRSYDGCSFGLLRRGNPPHCSRQRRLPAIHCPDAHSDIRCYGPPGTLPLGAASGIPIGLDCIRPLFLEHLWPPTRGGCISPLPPVEPLGPGGYIPPDA